MADTPFELAAGGFAEVGSSGLETYSGFIAEAYNRELDWPQCAPLYNRIWRSDPELSIVRLIFDAWSAQQTISAYVPEEVPGKDLDKPTDDDKRASDFYQSVLDDIDGGINRWLSSCVSRVPFYGWGWWEVLPGVRDPGWKAPADDPWRSDYDDGLIGFRRFAFRRYSSFYSWEISESSGRWTGMHQLDSPNPPVLIPLDRSLHVLFGDMDNPEGLATMEALWRLERYKWNLELIQGMGYEHSAGHAKFESTKKLDDTDNALIRKAARAVSTAQEGNYISLPEHIKFNFEDVPFAAGGNILQAVRYYSVLKLAVWGMQWVSIASLADTGSYSAIKDASEGAINIFNSMTEGFVSQLDEQVGRRLFDYKQNLAAFPGMTRRPRLSVSPVRKSVSLQELGAFIQAMSAVFALSQDDMNAIRLESGILEPVTEEIEEPEEAEPLEGEETDTEEVEEDALDTEAEMVFHLANNTGVMVAFYLPPDLAVRYALFDDEEKATLIEGALSPGDLHLTLAFLGDVSEQKLSKRKLLRVMQTFAARTPIISGKINGYGRFTNTNADGKDAVWLSVDAPLLPDMRQFLVKALDVNGFSLPSEHGFTPHITLAYVDKDKEINFDFEPSQVDFDAIFVAWGDEVYMFRLLGDSDQDGESELVFRPFIVSDKEQPVTLEHEAEVTEKDIDRAVRAFHQWAEENDPVIAALLDAEVVEDAGS